MIRTTTCALLLALPSGLVAQQLHISTFAARNGGLTGAPPLVGVAATAFLLGPVGVRVGGAMDAPSSPIAPLLPYGETDATRAWSGDLDMVLSGAQAGVRIGALEPSVFAGFGVHGLRQPDGTTSTIPVWSYGASASTPLASWASLDVEGRYRMPHQSDADLLPPDVGGGWELRTGLSLRIGSARPRARTPARRVPVGTRRGDDGARSPTGTPATWPAGDHSSASSAALAASALQTADQYVGVPYVWGGESPAHGFDCSGFVLHVFARHGIHLPRVSRDQARAGRRVDPLRSELREGDLLFFAGRDGVIDHVAIYAGDGTIIHSSSSRGAVGYDRLDSSRGRWYAENMVVVRRVIP